MWNERSLARTALTSRTGIDTSPKLIAPVQIACAMAVSFERSYRTIVVESFRRDAAIAMSAMMTTATTAMMIHVVADISVVVVFVVVVVVDELVVAPVTGA